MGFLNSLIFTEFGIISILTTLVLVAVSERSDNNKNIQSQNNSQFRTVSTLGSENTFFPSVNIDSTSQNNGGDDGNNIYFDKNKIINNELDKDYIVGVVIMPNGNEGAQPEGAPKPIYMIPPNQNEEDAARYGASYSNKLGAFIEETRFAFVYANGIAKRGFAIKKTNNNEENKQQSDNIKEIPFFWENDSEIGKAHILPLDDIGDFAPNSYFVLHVPLKNETNNTTNYIIKNDTIDQNIFNDLVDTKTNNDAQKQGILQNQYPNFELGGACFGGEECSFAYKAYNNIQYNSEIDGRYYDPTHQMKDKESGNEI